MNEAAFGDLGEWWHDHVFAPRVGFDYAPARPEAAEDWVDRLRDEVLRHFDPREEMTGPTHPGGAP